MGPYSSGAGGSAVPDRLRSRTVQDPLPRSREAAGTKVGRPGEGTAGRRPRRGSRPTKGSAASPSPKVSSPLFLRPVCLGHAWRGAMTASLFRLVLGGGGRRLGKLCSLGAAGREVRIIKRFRWPSWSPAWLFGLDLAEFALAVAFPLEIPLPFPFPFPFSIRIPVPLDCLGPEGRLGFKRAVRGLLQAGSRRFERGRFAGEGPPAGRRRLAHPPIPRRTGGAFRIDRGAHERTCPGAHDLGPGAISIRVPGLGFGPRRVVEQEARGETPRWAVRVLTGGDRPGRVRGADRAASIRMWGLDLA